MRLIVAGGLNRGTESSLGERLGVSTRHLRRLFDLHLGTTPDALARAARVQLAKRLLEDSDLTNIEVAFAAGFGSVRQFNRACQTAFHAPPRDVRAGLGERTPADWALSMRLRCRGSHDWNKTLSSLASDAIPGVESVSEGAYRRTIVTGNEVGAIELLPASADELVLRAHTDRWEELVHVVERIRRIADLDPVHSGPTRLHTRPGARVSRSWDSFEAGLRAIVARQHSNAAAPELLGLIVQRLGRPAAGLGHLGLTHAFPSPDAIATGDLTGIGIPPILIQAMRASAAAAHPTSVPA